MALSHDAINAGVAPRKIQPGWVRISHWLNALAALVMMLSGWRIYNASPVFPPFRFPGDITLGGWLGGALQWHFAAMWLLFFNGIFYLAMNLATGRFAHKFFPCDRVPCSMTCSQHCAAACLTPISVITTRCRSWPIWG